MFCAESMLYVVKSFDKMFANNGQNFPTSTLCSHIISQASAISWQNAMHHSLASRSRQKEFCLQVKTNEADQWRTVDSVNDNTEMQTDRLSLSPSTPDTCDFTSPSPTKARALQHEYMSLKYTENLIL